MKQFFSAFTVFLLFSGAVLAQKDSLTTGKDSVILRVEQMPEFPGGQEALYKFISDNILYPKDARENDIKGKVVVQFIVEKDGSVQNVEVVSGVHPLLDEEALRIVKLLPSFKPGMVNGEPVRVRMKLPITFNLESGGTKKKEVDGRARKLQLFATAILFALTVTAIILLR